MDNADLQGRTAKAHIDKWHQYGDKAQQHGTSAAIILTAARSELGNCKYGRWLAKYEIAPRTASRLLLEYHNPQAIVSRKEYDKSRKQKERDDAKAHRETAGSGRKTADKPLNSHKTRVEQPTPPPSPEPSRREKLIAFIRQAPDGLVNEVYETLLPYLMNGE